MRFPILLDSGAYSVRKRGAAVSLDDYCRFIQDHRDLIGHYVALDVLPGEPGRRRLIPSDGERSAKESYANYQTMRGRGLEPIPVFHMGEDIRWLERLLAGGVPYIGLGLFRNARARQHQEWLDEVWQVLTDGEGRSLVKVHGFGVTMHALLFRYPWASVDSTSWSLMAANGRIISPGIRNGSLDYTAKPRALDITPYRDGSRRGDHFDNLHPLHQDHLVKWLAEHVGGLTLAEVRYGHQNRRRALLTYFQGIEQCRRELDLYYASTAGSHGLNDLLTEFAVRCRLYSYSDLREHGDTFIRTLLTTGRAPPSTARPRILKPDWHSRAYRDRRALALLARLRTTAARGRTNKAP